MRLTQIKLAGFKSFVDPTTIGTPGQLVGIVGPNGCGKSNVIDAVRWVLGESKASALRGESMQDVIFNGAGDRKPVGRASVELNFDNSQGRIGGQWGQYAELSIKRMLTRDGDSTYYINNIPVRRRDIHDLFLGTGLGPRAYAIIEQGMISRVIEAKPEDLRIFLEEAAGVSKYKERRRETEGRLSDTRENLARVEDIRLELGNQLAKLDEQAKVAVHYRELDQRHHQAQHLLWYAKGQDAVRARERAASEIASLTVALEALQADLRQTETRLTTLRDDHFAAGDALHARQAEFYAANAEVTRLEQQLAFARESATRLSEQVAQITQAIAALAAQQAALDTEQSTAEAALAQALDTRERTAEDERSAQGALPACDAALGEAAKALSDLQQQIALTEQGIRVAEARRDSVAQSLSRIGARRDKLDAELAALAPPESDALRAVEDQLAQETGDLAERQQQQAQLQATVQSLQQRQRESADQWQRDAKALGDLEARSAALAALQAKIGHGSDIDSWLRVQGLTGARRLWQVLDIEPGWEDALEAMLRERLNALQLAKLDDALRFVGDAKPPGRLAVYAEADPGPPPAASGDALFAKVRAQASTVARFLADSLHGIRCRADLAAALADRGALLPGEAFVTPQGHWVNAQGIAFFAPDSELHGVLARQRELAELATGIDAARITAAQARAALDAVESELKERQSAYHQESGALASQQRRCHDLELEVMQLRQEAEAAAHRRVQIGQEVDDLAAQHAQASEQQRAIAAEIADMQSRFHDEIARREAGRLGDEIIGAAHSAARPHEAVAENILLADNGGAGGLEAGLDAEHGERYRGLGQAQGLRPGTDGAEIEQFVIGEHVTHAVACAVAPQRDRHPFARRLQRQHPLRDGLEHIGAGLGAFGREIMPGPRADIDHARGVGHRERRQCRERRAVEAFFPFVFRQIKPRRRQRLVGRRRAVLLRLAARVVVIGDLGEALVRGVFGQMFERQRRSGQIIDQCFELIVKQRQPVLHAGIAAALAHRFVEQIVRRGRAEFGHIAGAEAADGFGDELEFRHRHQIEPAQLRFAELRLRIEGADGLQGVAEKIETDGRVHAGRIEIEDAAAHRIVARLAHRRGAREAVEFQPG
ncbi:MAG: chromosome segregation protein SMC, partial [Burkholderiales bacterium]